jgi:predicted DNA-binding transcriptional regulator AlpA
MTTPVELWRLPKVLSVVGMGKTQVLEAVAAGTFPPPVQILSTGRAVAWVSTEVLDYVAQRIARRDAELSGEAE